MAVFNMSRPNTRPYSGGMGRPQPNTASSFASESAKYGAKTRPPQSVQPELGSKMKPGYGAKMNPGIAPQRPPQTVQPIGSSFSGQANFARPVETIQPIGGGFSGNASFGQRPVETIQPIGGGFAGNADFGQRQYPMNLASLGERFGGGQAPQTGALPWWYRNNQQPQNQQIGSLGAALDQFRRGGQTSVMNPTFHML